MTNCHLSDYTQDSFFQTCRTYTLSGRHKTNLVPKTVKLDFEYTTKIIRAFMPRLITSKKEFIFIRNQVEFQARKSGSSVASTSAGLPNPILDPFGEDKDYPDSEVVWRNARRIDNPYSGLYKQGMGYSMHKTIRKTVCNTMYTRTLYDKPNKRRSTS